MKLLDLSWAVSTRTFNTLSCHGYESVEQVWRTDYRQLHGLGEKGAREIESMLAEWLNTPEGFWKAGRFKS